MFLTSEADTKSSSRSGGSAMASVNVFQKLSYPEAPKSKHPECVSCIEDIQAHKSREGY